jgi:hypothetical protein
MADSTADKARKARNRAFDQDYPVGYSRGSTDRLVMDLTRGKEKLIDKALYISVYYYNKIIMKNIKKHIN